MWTRVKKVPLYNISFLLLLPRFHLLGKKKQTTTHKQKPEKQNAQTLHSVLVHRRSNAPRARLAFGRSTTKLSRATKMLSLHSSCMCTCLGVAFYRPHTIPWLLLRQGYIIKPSSPLLSFTGAWNTSHSVEKNLQAYSQAAIGLSHKGRRLLIKISTSKARQGWGGQEEKDPFTPALILGHYWCLGRFIIPRKST